MIEKGSKQCWTLDIACPADNKVYDKEGMKKDKYDRLALELKQLWSMKKVTVITIIVGALGTVSKDLENYIEQLGITAENNTTSNTCRKQHYFGRCLKNKDVTSVYWQ